MQIEVRDAPPSEIKNLEKENISSTDVVEIFETPLVGSYNWDYSIQDNRIKRLYELGKKLNWNAETDLDWSIPYPGVTEQMFAFEDPQWHDHKVYKTWNKEKRLEFLNDMNAWYNSQFLHGEQGSLLVASQLCSCAPTYNAKLYAASQTFDEARHVEVFNKYVHTRIKKLWPVSVHFKALLDKILTDPRWDLKFIGMQIILEGLALSAFKVAKWTSQDPVYIKMLDLILRDEARHVTFGISYLKEYLETLTDEERRERAVFALEACRITRNRFVPYALWEHYGMDPEYTDEIMSRSEIKRKFQENLFSSIMPNLKRIGLLEEEFIPEYEKLGVVSYIDGESDYDTSWENLSKPL